MWVSDWRLGWVSLIANVAANLDTHNGAQLRLLVDP